MLRRAEPQLLSGVDGGGQRQAKGTADWSASAPAPARHIYLTALSFFGTMCVNWSLFTVLTILVTRKDK